MGIVFSLVAAAAGAGAGWTAARWQHLLYQQEEYRLDPASGRRATALQALAAVATAVAWGLAFRPGHYDAGPASLTAGFALVLVVLACTDFERRIIPNRLSYPAIVVAALFCWAWPDRSVGAIWGGVGFALGIGALVFVFGLAMGGLLGIKATPFGLGDVKLIILLGLLCGWPAITTALLFGALLAGVPSIALMVRGRSRTVFSYGPYLVAGGLVVLLFPDSFV